MDPVSRAQNSDNAPVKKKIGRPWPKGVSGNPGGRPKKRHFSEICEALLEDVNGRKMVKNVITDILEKRGMASVLLMREIAERTEGKVKQEVELNATIDTLSDEELELRLKAIVELAK